INNLDKKIKDIDIISEEEKNELLYEFNNTDIEFNNKENIISLLENKIQNNKEKVAIVYGKESLTYEELGRKINSFSSILVEQGVKPGDIVAVLDEISINTIVEMISIMKIGAIYLPIDKELPKDRIKYMLDSSNSNLLLINGQVDFYDFDKSYKLYFIKEKDFNKSTIKNINHSVNRNDLAYIIYTSGTTGNPKGVMIEHKSLINQILGLKNRYNFEYLNHILMAPLVFDPSIQQILLPLTTNGCLYLIDKSTKIDSRELIKVIKKNNIGILNTVPSLFNRILDDEEAINGLKLEYIILAGEEFSKSTYEKIVKMINCKKIINIYGPTEATINSTIYECGNESNHRKIPIGKPLDNYKIYVLDKNLKLVPKNM
ncbi:amino acid adenylation domain-containing protein, partial [Clostridium perfringens]|uniref:AMP-binding protein n=1 Tax=Clostridium perfringens TaxID=1502 RepID=UPI0013E3D2D0